MKINFQLHITKYMTNPDILGLAIYPNVVVHTAKQFKGE
jgi:hypothetical protein